MANSLILQLTVNGIINGVPIAPVVTQSLIPSTNWFVYDTQSAATSSTAVYLGSIVAVRKLMIVNLDTTNYVNVAFDNANTTPQKLLPASGTNYDYVVLNPTTGIWVKANTAPCQILVIGFDT